MSGTIPIEQLSQTVAEIMAGYDEEAQAAVKRAVDRTASATDAEIRRHITFKDRTGEYRKAFAIKKAGDRRSKYSATWYVKAPRYRLTHLLENGHMNRDGSRTKGYPHIAYGEKLAKAMLPEETEKELGK